MQQALVVTLIALVTFFINQNLLFSVPFFL